MRNLIKRLIRSLGYDISRYTPEYHFEARRMSLINRFNIDVLYDIGANAGQYALTMRELDYTGRIISFEPLSKIYNQLQEVASYDQAWEVLNYGLGNFDGEAEINIAGNSASSSLLEMLPQHSNAAPDSAYIGKEKILVKRLDAVFDNLLGNSQYPFVKIDTQGYTKPVFDGARRSLEKICGIQAEVALTPLYEGEILLPDMVRLLNENGFDLMSIEPGFADANTGQQLQVDCVFFRK